MINHLKVDFMPLLRHRKNGYKIPLHASLMFNALKVIESLKWMMIIQQFSASQSTLSMILNLIVIQIVEQC